MAALGNRTSQSFQTSRAPEKCELLFQACLKMWTTFSTLIFQRWLFSATTFFDDYFFFSNDELSNITFRIWRCATSNDNDNARRLMMMTSHHHHSSRHHHITRRIIITSPIKKQIYCKAKKKVILRWHFVARKKRSNYMAFERRKGGGVGRGNARVRTARFERQNVM